MRDMYTNNDSFYLGLSSTLPESDGSNVNEPEGNSYARVQVGGFTDPVNGVVKNINALTFPKSSGIWFPAESKAKYWVLFDGALSDANLLSSGELDEEKTVESNTTITIEAETLSVTLSDYQTASA